MKLEPEKLGNLDDRLREVDSAGLPELTRGFIDDYLMPGLQGTLRSVRVDRETSQDGFGYIAEESEAVCALREDFANEIIEDLSREDVDLLVVADKVRAMSEQVLERLRDFVLNGEGGIVFKMFKAAGAKAPIEFMINDIVYRMEFMGVAPQSTFVDYIAKLPDQCVAKFDDRVDRFKELGYFEVFQRRVAEAVVLSGGQSGLLSSDLCVQIVGEVGSLVDFYRKLDFLWSKLYLLIEREQIEQEIDELGGSELDDDEVLESYYLVRRLVNSRQNDTEASNFFRLVSQRLEEVKGYIEGDQFAEAVTAVNRLDNHACSVLHKFMSAGVGGFLFRYRDKPIIDSFLWDLESGLQILPPLDAGDSFNACFRRWSIYHRNDEVNELYVLDSDKTLMFREVLCSEAEDLIELIKMLVELTKIFKREADRRGQRDYRYVVPRFSLGLEEEDYQPDEFAEKLRGCIGSMSYSMTHADGSVEEIETCELPGYCRHSIKTGRYLGFSSVLYNLTRLGVRSAKGVSPDPAMLGPNVESYASRFEGFMTDLVEKYLKGNTDLSFESASEMYHKVRAERVDLLSDLRKMFSGTSGLTLDNKKIFRAADSLGILTHKVRSAFNSINATNEMAPIAARKGVSFGEAMGRVRAKMLRYMMFYYQLLVMERFLKEFIDSNKERDAKLDAAQEAVRTAASQAEQEAEAARLRAEREEAERSAEAERLEAEEVARLRGEEAAKRAREEREAGLALMQEEHPEYVLGGTDVVICVTPEGCDFGERVRDLMVAREGLDDERVQLVEDDDGLNDAIGLGSEEGMNRNLVVMLHGAKSEITPDEAFEGLVISVAHPGAGEKVYVWKVIEGIKAQLEVLQERYLLDLKRVGD